MQIQENSRVTLHFALRLDTGETIDSTFDRAPVTLDIGDGNLPSGFEQHLFGLTAGDHHTVKVPPQDAFGQINPSNRQAFKRDKFAHPDELTPGLVISFADAAHNELPGVVVEVSDQWVEVDFNHPLAGKWLDFEVEIIEVEQQSAH